MKLKRLAKPHSLRMDSLGLLKMAMEISKANHILLFFNKKIMFLLIYTSQFVTKHWLTLVKIRSIGGLGNFQQDTSYPLRLLV